MSQNFTTRIISDNYKHITIYNPSIPKMEPKIDPFPKIKSTPV